VKRVAAVADAVAAVAICTGSGGRRVRVVVEEGREELEKGGGGGGGGHWGVGTADDEGQEGFARGLIKKWICTGVDGWWLAA
jgi:hypothetical protein